MTTEKCDVEHIDVYLEKDRDGCCLGDRYRGYLIEEKHSYEDIARFIIDQGWEDDLMELLSNPEFVKDAKGEL